MSNLRHISQNPYFVKKVLAFLKHTGYNLTCVSGCGSAWLERHLREVEVASSNPATPTKNIRSFSLTETSDIFFINITLSTLLD